MTLKQLGLIAALSGFAAPAAAQWTVTSLHPPQATQSWAHAVRDGKQVVVVVLGNSNRAALWTGTPAWVNLNPSGSNWSEARGLDATGQVGMIDNGGGRAGYWNGSASSWVDLHPHPWGVLGSQANCMEDGYQFGQVGMANGYAAGRWSGTPGSFEYWNPAGSTRSEILGAGGGQQVGYVRFSDLVYRASLWNGSAGSWVDLHPAGATHSQANGVHAGQQVGWWTVSPGPTGGRACLWTGSAASWVDLHPAGAQVSRAEAVHAGVQVGRVSYPGSGSHACLWTGTAASMVDLHVFLPSGFSTSGAYGVWSDTNGLFVVGSGFNASLNRSEALLWTYCYPDCDASGALDVNDYICFQTKFAVGDPYADCDGSGARNVNDYICFQTRFALGCP